MEFGCHFLLDLPLDLFIKVLMRLPHLQILKCMFVSKSFCSIIRQPKFIEGYCRLNPICLLISTSNTNVCGRSLYCCNLNPSGGELGSFKLKDLDPSCINANAFRGRGGREQYGVTEIINGFLCYYYDSSAVLVNIFSGELTVLPSPIVLADTLSPVFYFGFDPINRIYKLLCCTKLVGGRFHYAPSVFHILTIDGTANDFSWRMLPPFTEDYYCPNFYPNNSVSVNGSLYWIESRAWNFQSSNRIISFDLTREKFRSFMPPPGADGEFFSHARLVQFRGRLSLLSCIGIDIILIYTLEMGGNGDGNDNPYEWSQMSGNGNPYEWTYEWSQMDGNGNCNAYEWSKHTIILPVEFRGVAVSIGNLPNGNLLFLDLSKDGNLVTPVYSYNHETERFVRLGGGAKFPDDWKIWEFETSSSGLGISVVEQTINGIDALISRFSPRY